MTIFPQLVNIVKKAGKTGSKKAGSRKQSSYRKSEASEATNKKRKKKPSKKGFKKRKYEKPDDEKTSQKKSKSGVHHSPPNPLYTPDHPESWSAITDYLSFAATCEPEAMAKVGGAGLDITTVKRLSVIPIGGRIAHSPAAWRTVTTDQWVLNIIDEGYKVQFVTLPETPRMAPNPPTDEAGVMVLDGEVEAMLSKGTI